MTESPMTLAALVGAGIAHREKATMTAAAIEKTRQSTRTPRSSASSVGPLLSSALEMGGRSSRSSRGRRRSGTPKRSRSSAAPRCPPLRLSSSSTTVRPPCYSHMIGACHAECTSKGLKPIRKGKTGHPPSAEFAPANQRSPRNCRGLLIEKGELGGVWGTLYASHDGGGWVP